MKKAKFYKKVKNNAQNTKQNQDFPNVPQTPKSEGLLLKLIKIK